MILLVGVDLLQSLRQVWTSMTEPNPGDAVVWRTFLQGFQCSYTLHFVFRQSAGSWLWHSCCNNLAIVIRCIDTVVYIISNIYGGLVATFFNQYRHEIQSYSQLRRKRQLERRLPSVDEFSTEVIQSYWSTIVLSLNSRLWQEK